MSKEQYIKIVKNKHPILLSQHTNKYLFSTSLMLIQGHCDQLTIAKDWNTADTLVNTRDTSTFNTWPKYPLQ